MKNIKTLFALIAGCILLLTFSIPGSASASLNLLPKQTATATKQAVTVPQKAYTVAEYVAQNGRPPKGYVGGTVFQNREGLLPQGVNYKEYDVNPKVSGQNRGTERIILGDDGSRYYTNDHYQSFTQF
ncbi:ribonuclease domain-containing protein [Pedobacter cryoconitis]|uniref:Ribonuclease n=1 Tax=Pedobacter cryoconitis TaxID=188932 RepID=A0A7X0J415_9SPHI|nr:ribonuclease domain-containing protein [Pedobacter cryoconitis]MBB6499407.1 ribonuclease T1 [Pedobacter cryoconitis]